ncbi:MAG: hypothetical protein IJS65_03945 [Clostridia bacterium]|nr:hypothetical protein [Clostridia bacterium]
MKKPTALFLALLFTLALYGCGSRNVDSVKSEETKEASETSSKADTTAADFDDGKALDDKLKLYDSTAYFSDTLIPHIYLIIGSKSVVYVHFLNDTEFVNEIPLDSVARIESISVGAYTVVKIYDKAGKELSFNADSNDVQKITESLQK